MFSAGSRKCPWGLKKIQWIHYNLEATRVHPVCWRVWVICMTSSSLRFPTDFSSVLPCSKGVSTAVTFWWKFEECVISYLKEFITTCLRKRERKGESKQQQNNKRETFPHVCVCVWQWIQIDLPEVDLSQLSSWWMSCVKVIGGVSKMKQLHSIPCIQLPSPGLRQHGWKPVEPAFILEVVDVSKYGRFQYAQSCKCFI